MLRIPRFCTPVEVTVRFEVRIEASLAGPADREHTGVSEEGLLRWQVRFCWNGMILF